MKKLTDDWKIKKKISTSCSFKESIDFKICSPEKKQSAIAKRGVPLKSKEKSASDLKILKHVQPNQSNVLLRRSTRLLNKSTRNEDVGTKSSFQENHKSLLSHNISEKSEELGNVSHKHEEPDELPTFENDGCNLSQWGLPSSIVQAYNSRNINNMFQWQYDCLLMNNVLDGGNLVFSAPTSAGKTLVAEILMLKSVTETKKKAIMILPFVSVVREKVHYFQEMFESAGIVVDGYMGAHNPPGGFKSVDIAICTMEKANNLVNRLMEEKRLGEIGILVVDELHMLGDQGRGYLLELLLTKLLYNCKKNNTHIQVVGMSATLPNLDVLAFWLGSELYRTDFRPVPLQEMVKVGSVIYDAKSKVTSRDLRRCEVSFSDDADHIVLLSIETITSGHGVLIFCPSKNWCENLATSIAREIYNAGRPRDVADGNVAYNAIGEKLRAHLNGNQLNDIIQQLKSSPAGLDSVLGLTVPFGVAYHHAGLTFDERDIIEGAFRQGIVKILVATSTLSSGVNLPARRVIIRSPLFCGSVIDVLSYKQMVGRAGRKGIDDEGESILICKETERNVALSLVNSELRPVQSCLLKSGTSNLHSSLKKALIEIIASGVASTQKEVLHYVTCTLLYASLAKETESSNNRVESSIEKCIDYLVENDIIFKHEENKNEVMYKPSRLGLAILASGFSPDDALRVLKELQLARRCFVLENDLHILYEVTPPYLSEQMGSLNWMHFLSLWEDLPQEYRRVGELVGVQENFMGLGIQGRLNKAHHSTHHKMAVHQRFYATLALNDLIQEVPLPVVAKKYDCTRGVLQSLQQSTSTFAGMLTTFCNRLGWHNLELLFSSFQKRVHFGVQQELCDLVRLPTLNAQRARALYNAGLETVSQLAAATEDEVALVLINMGSFESAKQLEGALAEEALQRHEAKRIRITGKAGVNEKEAAHLIVQEAQHFIQQELGISTIHWKHRAAKNFEDLSEENSMNRQATSPMVETSPLVKRTADNDRNIQKRLKASEDTAAVDIESSVSDKSGCSATEKTPQTRERVTSGKKLRSSDDHGKVDVESNREDKSESPGSKSTGTKNTASCKRTIQKRLRSSDGKETANLESSIPDQPECPFVRKTSQAQRSVTAEGSLENRLKSSKRHAKTNFESDMAGCSAVKTTSKSRKATNVNEYQQNLLTSLSDKALGKLESNISDQTEFPAIRTAQTKKSSSGFRNTQNKLQSSSELSIANPKKKHFAPSMESKSSDRVLNESDDADGHDLEKYPEILRQMYTKDSCKELAISSPKLNVQEEDVFDKSLDRHENHGPVVVSGSILSKNVSKELPKNISFKPVDKTCLHKENFNGDIDHQSRAKNETVTFINESFYANFDEKFCSFEDARKSCSKLETEDKVKDDDMNFNELLLSQTANADCIYFTESFNALPNQNSINDENLNDLVLLPIKHDTETNDCVSKRPNYGIDAQCSNSNKKGVQKYSFLEASELNLMSESCFSFELQNTSTCQDGFPEKNSTPIPEVKSKSEKSSFTSNHSNSSAKSSSKVKLSHSKEKSSENENIPPFKSPHEDSFNVSKYYDMLLDMSSKTDSMNHSRTHLQQVVTSKVSPSKLANKNSINETSVDIFETEESFNSEGCINNKVRLIVEPGSNTEKLNTSQIKTETAETSCDIFDDSFDICKVEFETERDTNQSKSENKKINDKLKTDNNNLVIKQAENFKQNEMNAELNYDFVVPIDKTYKTREFNGMQMNSDNLKTEIKTFNISSDKTSKTGEFNGMQMNCDNLKTELETYNVSSDKTSKTGEFTVMQMNSNNLKTDIGTCNTSPDDAEIPLLNTNNQSQFWNTWDPSQESFLTPKPTQRSKAKSVKSVPDVPLDKEAKLDDSKGLMLDSADNSLFNSFNSDCLSPTPDKSSKSLAKIQVSSRKISSGFLPIPKSKESLKKNKTLVGKENSSPNITEEEGHFKDDSQIRLNINGVPDAELNSFLKRTAKVKTFSLSVACEKLSTKRRTIGPAKSNKCILTSNNQWTVDPDITIVGISICYRNEAYYISCCEDGVKSNNNLEFSTKSKLLQGFFTKSASGSSIVAYDTKSQYKVLWQGCNIALKQKCLDPSIAAWLLDPGKGHQSLKMLLNNFWPEAACLMDDLDYTSGSLGLQHWHKVSGKERASTEAFVSFHVMDKVLAVLKEQKLYKSFNEIEMQSVLSFAKMEQNGLGFDTTLATSYHKELQKKQEDILDKAYQMAGRRFNILSSRDVSRILYKELKLSPTLAPDSPLINRHLGSGRCTRSRKIPPELKTNRECLEKIIHLHPLPKAILDWRRLSFSTSKVLMPLLRERKHDPYFGMDRLYSNSYYYTLTGRVNVHSPNLQFVPRNFNIDSGPGANEDAEQEEDYHCKEDDVLQYGISIRNLFIPSKGNILLAADYTQLELRILAHLSNEKKLLASLNSDEDVFKNIAAKWKNIPITAVSGEQRQQAKKICYGMIYGMSANSLAQQLNTTKEEAQDFMETFKKSYPGLNNYFQRVIAECQNKGYVSTLMQRRRYLPMISSHDKAKQAHASRQAINTTIQGSAADIIKAAMIKIEKELQEKFPDTSEPYSSKNGQNSKTKTFRGGFLVLQMHDELIYEVSRNDLQLVLGTVKKAMETTTQLTVKLPVQVKFGTSWGNLTELS
ncbi:hypothetical protein JTE90_026190 [Oedothorax gibbosus]|uniref:DNA polymerase theta n=1 Tax=Oedothorax gibbosus TaxID=931172 RepID=A0AAV6U0Q0_9ARAC|nr:hypothetical protein JTE90_026190 [Oedothorax gibbosus]